MKNMMKEYLGNDYSNNHLRNFCLYWIKGLECRDRYARTEGVDWFPEEIPSRGEYEEGLDNLEKCGYRVDYIITHTAPSEVAAALGYGEESHEEVALRRYLQQIADEAEYNLWFFGHFHEDEVIEDVFIAMYDEIVVVDQDGR